MTTNRSPNTSLTTLIAALIAIPSVAAATPNGDATITAVSSSKTATLKTLNTLAGAVDSLVWDGKEFIESHDHGRQIQGALNFQDFAECYNPTEAGSSEDGVATNPSTSLLTGINVWPNIIQTSSKMAFWLSPTNSAPFGCTPGGPINTVATSNFTFQKEIMLNPYGYEHTIRYNTLFTFPTSGQFTIENGYDLNTKGVQFETPTGYHPSEFDVFYTYDVVNNPDNGLALLSLSAPTVPAGQTPPPGLTTATSAYPLIISTGHSASDYAVGVYSQLVTDHFGGAWPTTTNDINAYYGAFRFGQDHDQNGALGVSKWNVVLKQAPRNWSGYSDGTSTYVFYGTRSQVITAIRRIYNHLN